MNSGSTGPAPWHRLVFEIPLPVKLATPLDHRKCFQSGNHLDWRSGAQVSSVESGKMDRAHEITSNKPNGQITVKAT